MPARRADLRRAALRHLPAQGGGQTRQGRKGVHGRTAPDDAARHVRHQRGRARSGQPVAPVAGHRVRGHPASQRENPAQLPRHPRSRFLVRGAIRHQRPAVRLSRPQETPPEIPDDDVLPRAEFSRCGSGRQRRRQEKRRHKNRHRRGNPQALLRNRGTHGQGSRETRRFAELRFDSGRGGSGKGSRGCPRF